ncbi:hypothetical protein [Aeromicrobium sp.]|uniref:hypothetical protein n=1 Tax=Aeromicrobium sp. TaxID=1871063 RepID=UPI0025BE4FD1|nr:hypothetical protein [Aeromicrobium sp.]MCK5891360.1 hypothetical protein [Aeromicrobium sp.]
MSGQQPPRRRRIAGENKPGATPAKPQARKAVPARPVVPTPKPAAPRRDREDKKRDREDKKRDREDKKRDRDDTKVVGRQTDVAPATPAVRRPARPARPAVSTPDPAVDARDDAASQEDSASEGRRRPNLRAALPVLVLLLGVAAAGVGYWQMQREAPLSQSQAQEAADAAATAVEKVLSFDYRDLDAYEAGVDGLLTDTYVTDELEPSIAALREQAPTAQVQVQTTVQAAATETCQGECPAGEASVLVVIDKVTLTANLQEPTVTPQRLRVDMVEQDGRWLVGSIAYIGS